MASSQFINIPEMEGLLNSYSSTNQPIEYKIPVTYLQNLSSIKPMIIDSSSNIILQARNNHVRVNNKMGIGLDPSSAYSLHVLGDTCISGNIISNQNITSRTAYINDVSVSSIDISVNLNPLVPNKGTIGLVNRPWGNAYINDVSVSSIDVSTNLNPLIPNKGTIGFTNKPWGNAYINDVSVSSIDVSTNLNPLVPNKGTIGLSNKPWGNAYINDISATNISVNQLTVIDLSSNNISSVINSLLARISLLELTAITRTVDVVTPISNLLTIAIDLSNYNSVEIHATVRFYGNTNISRLYAGYIDASGNSQFFRFTAIEVALQSGGFNQTYASNDSDLINRGMLMYDMNVSDLYGNSNFLVFKIFRPYDMFGLVEGGYTGHSLWSNTTGGRLRGEFFGNYYSRPTSLIFFTSTDTTFQARYSIVSDKRN